MQQRNAYLHQHHVDLGTLPQNAALFSTIADDLRRNAKQHRPADVWLAAGGGGDGQTPSAFSPEKLLGPWLGFGSTRITDESSFWYHDYLRSIDRLGLVEHYFADEGGRKETASALLVADLGSIIDVNLASAFVEQRDGQPLYVVEVGGGYGRLAEAFFNIFPRQVKWVFVDAVPSSLLYAYEYLTRSNPDIKVGFSYRDDPFDMDRFDCYIAPTWRMESLPKNYFDLAINVQSMQEMDQHHVDYYLQWFDGALRHRGIAYLCNRRDHVFRGQWNYPDHWECLLYEPTPRSFTRDFPAEVHRKGERSYRTENQLRLALYRHRQTRMTEQLREAGLARGYKLY